MIRVSITMFQRVLENASEPHLPPGNMQRLTTTPYERDVISSASKTSAHDNIGAIAS